MVDLLKKTVFTAVGLAAMTRDKIEEAGKKIAEEAKLSEQEGKQFVDELKKKAEEARLATEKLINEKVESALKAISVPTRSDITAIEKRLLIVEQKLSEIEKGNNEK